MRETPRKGRPAAKAALCLRALVPSPFPAKRREGGRRVAPQRMYLIHAAESQ